MAWFKNFFSSSARKNHRGKKSPRLFESLEQRSLMAADVLPVLMVIADQQDFYYREYGDTRVALEQEGVAVEVAATTTSPSRPHRGTGEPAGTDGTVVPDIALSDVDADDYSAIVFVGGWGSSMYQYAFEGTYSNSRYNGDLTTQQVVNDLINDFVADDKYVAAICHGVTVLAWARVDGASPLSGKEVATPFIGSPAVVYEGQYYSNYQLGQAEQIAVNGGINSAYSGARGADPNTVADDVVVDGRIITAENYDAALSFGFVVGQQVKAAAEDAVGETPVDPPIEENQAPTVSNQTFSLYENSPAGTIVGSVLASDNDVGQTLSYQIAGGNLNHAFAIDPATGAISVANATALDFESTPIFELIVNVTDDAAVPASASATITVQLLDVVEAPTPGVFFDGLDLRVQGTADADRIYIWSGATANQVFVWMNGTSYGSQAIPLGGHVRVFAGNGNDNVFATDSRFAVEIHGEAGHDLITGGTANDLLIGGDGVDRIHGFAGDDLIFGEAGNDRLYGYEGNDLLIGGDGEDGMDGGDGNDILIGGLGRDWAYGRQGRDLLIGGRTRYDEQVDDLLSLQGAWLATTSGSSLISQMEAALSDNLFPNPTELEDNESDVLCGGEDADLIFANYLDYFCNDAADERVTA